uniref:G_PROTEIN_RECEP_F1_2 domain-containing protein n=1 Tax=Steinernema glaseri TaxID=37863 RepID=A0A1I7Z480_9BILA
MELYLFRPNEWDALYNCSRYHTEEEWWEEGSRNEILGLWYVITGILYMIPYIPCVRVMLKPELIKHSCFKIMVFLALIDFVCLSINGVLTGYLTIKGAVFCSYPNMIYITGQLGLGLWYVITGILYMIPYIPCVRVMLKPELIKHSCFKIMVFLALIDFVCLSINGVLTGYLTIKGAVFCSYPNMIYITGQLGLGRCYLRPGHSLTQKT